MELVRWRAMSATVAHGAAVVLAAGCCVMATGVTHAVQLARECRPGGHAGQVAAPAST